MKKIEFYIDLSEFLGDAKIAKFDSFNALIYTEYGSSSSNYIFHSNDNREAISALNNKNYCSVDNLNNFFIVKLLLQVLKPVC